MGKFENVYMVEFMEYTNCSMDTVSDAVGDSFSDICKANYLHIGKEHILIRESELDKYRKFGKGYRRVIFAGRLLIDTDKV